MKTPQHIYLYRVQTVLQNSTNTSVSALSPDSVAYVYSNCVWNMYSRENVSMKIKYLWPQQHGPFSCCTITNVFYAAGYYSDPLNFIWNSSRDPKVCNNTTNYMSSWILRKGHLAYSIQCSASVSPQEYFIQHEERYGLSELFVFLENYFIVGIQRFCNRQAWIKNIT